MTNHSIILAGCQAINDGDYRTAVLCAVALGRQPPVDSLARLEPGDVIRLLQMSARSARSELQRREHGMAVSRG